MANFTRIAPLGSVLIMKNGSTGKFILCDDCACCDNANYSDSFASEAAGWNWHASLPAFGGYPDKFDIVSGKVECTSVATGTLLRCLALPALNGLSLTLEADVWEGSSDSEHASIIFQSGLFVNLYAQISSGKLFRIVNSNSSEIGTVADGDTLKITIDDVSSGGGTYDIEFFKNAVSQEVMSSESLTFPDPLGYGFEAVRDVAAGSTTTVIGQWDDLVMTM